MSYKEELVNLVKSHSGTFTKEIIIDLYDQIENNYLENNLPNEWFVCNFPLQKLNNSERNIDFDIKEMVEGNGSIYVYSLFNPSGTVNTLIENYFKNFINDIVRMSNIKKIQLFLMNNIKVLDHVDSDDVVSQRILVPITVPDISNSEKLGLKINDKIISIDDNLIVFNGALTHSAWNFSGDDWIFLSVDVLEDIKI